jgi:hypothetical protein
MASPIQYYDKVIQDINLMKNHITKFQNDQINKFGLASPSYSAMSTTNRKNSNVSPERLKNRPNHALKNTQELTINDLTTDHYPKSSQECR